MPPPTTENRLPHRLQANDKGEMPMRLNRQSEIAIGILATCARAAGRIIRTMEAAETAATTRDHAAHVVNDLVHEGFLKTMRGRQGGIALAVPATEILLGDVLRRMQPDLVRHAEVRGADEPATANTAFNAIVGAAEATFLTFMDRFTVADLVSEAPARRIDCLDCELLNPARRKPGRAAASAPMAHLTTHSAFRRPDKAAAGLFLAERARTERTHHASPSC
ncbi:RrF2 family transcriptional regulator [Brucella intermedia]|uniref:RrF2 family transcriptional regulator n=1 Tax=Brucella intermedia TaxID=94625 RepID=UPI00178C1B4F|nr:Rrf2 family transcriptional regulator [Brucella intermedia]